MALVGRRLPLGQTAVPQSGSLGRATDGGRRLPVDLLEDRPLSRRRRLRFGAPIDAAVFPHCRAAVRAAVINWPARSRSVCRMAAARAGLTVNARGTILTMRGSRRAKPAERPEPPASPGLVKRLFEWVGERV